MQEPIEEDDNYKREWNFVYDVLGMKLPFMRLGTGVIWENVKILKEQVYITGSGKKVDLHEAVENMQHSTTVFGGYTEEHYEQEMENYRTWLQTQPKPPEDAKMVVEVLDQDCIKTAWDLEEKTGKTPLVLNLAQRWIDHVTGKWWHPFYGSQEESIERRSAVYRLGLDPKLNPLLKTKLCELTKSAELPKHHIPEFGVVCHQGVPILRDTNYNLHKHPRKIDICACGAIDLRSHWEFFRPDERHIYMPNGTLDEQLFIKHTKMKIRMILVSGVRLGYQGLVLGAFGCGVFLNPKEIIAKAFNDCLQEDEFKGRFSHVLFAIIGKSSCIPFEKQFD